ncbi:MAG: tRNA lysidine(34) synthetase TilS [Candidatus Krumholzibacteria bacterium]
MSPDDAGRLKESVKWFCLSEELIPEGSLVLAAVSGGPDSMALLSILHELGKDLGFRVTVGHFDHQIRPSSDDDRALVEEYARSAGLAFHKGRGDVPALAEASGDSLEEAARKARYRFLADVAEKIGAERIATGHTRNDQVETVIMRILRGTGIRGLTGIPTRRGKIVRPLLCLGREDTHAYCEALNIRSAVDPSNEDTRFVRNRIRRELLPLLEKSYHAGVEENLLRLSQNAQDVISHIRLQTQPLIERNLRRAPDGEWILNVSKIAALDETSLFVLFGDLLAESIGCDADFSRVHYEGLAQLVKDSRASGRMLSLPGLVVKREYENLVITRSTASAKTTPAWDYRATLTFPGDTQAAGLHVKTEILHRNELADSSLMATAGTACFAMDKLRLPLVLRSPVEGDRMQPFGMQGTKKLSDIFIDKKIPSRDRTRSLIVTDATGILWLVGVTTSEKSRVAETTDKIVRISIDHE